MKKIRGYGSMGLTKSTALKEKKEMQKKGYVGVVLQRTPTVKGTPRIKWKYDLRYKKYKGK